MANVENINKLIERLKADSGAHFRMSDWAGYIPEAREETETQKLLGNLNQPLKYLECKTAFCLAGSANLLRMEEEGIDWKAAEGAAFYQQFSNQVKAANWLGIIYDDLHADASDALFRMMDTHSYDYKLTSFDKLHPAIRRAAGIRVLEILRDEDRVDWDAAIEFAKSATGTAAL